MGDALQSRDEVSSVKTVQIDPAAFAVGAAGRRGRSRPQAPTVGIAAKSAALQAAVERALAATSGARPPPPPPPQTGASETKTITSTLVSSTLDDGLAVPASHPRSTVSVSTAVQELNRLMEERANARIRRTVRTRHRRAEHSDTPYAPVGTPLVGGSTAARATNDPPWGCLKGGQKKTFRKYRQTMRARTNPQADPTPQITISTNPPQPAPRKMKPPTVSNAVPGETVTVGRQRDGRVAFVVGTHPQSHTRRRITKSPSGQRNITNRARLRKARLLYGSSSSTPQRLIDVMADSVQSIGAVVRCAPPAPAT